MLAVISPAKTLDYDTPVPTSTYTQPDFLKASAELIEVLRPYSPQDISALMKISDKLGSLNAARFQEWQPPFTRDNARQAVLAFKGDVYVGLDAFSLDEPGFQYAQSHLRILSGLYGLLRPLDLIQAYRLEMGTRLKNPKGKDLYDFWGRQLAEKINQILTDHTTPTLINLASQEYFKAVDLNVLAANVITPVFKDWKNGQYKIISFHAKKARGLMCRYMIDQKLATPEGLKNFNYAGYQFDESQSTETQWVFTRRQEN